MPTLESCDDDASERVADDRLALVLRLALGGKMPDADTAGHAWFEPDRLGEVMREFVHVRPFDGWADKIVGKPRDVAKRNIAKALGRWLPEDADELPGGLYLKQKEIGFLLHQAAQVADARDVSDSDLEEFQGPDGRKYGYTAEGARAARKRVCEKLSRFLLEDRERPPVDEQSTASTQGRVSTVRTTSEPAALTAISEDAAPAIFQVAFPRNKYLTGRDDFLVDLHEALYSAGSVTIAQTLSGEGGIGKTQVAVAYAYKYRASYDLVWWISAEDIADIPRQLSDLALRLHLPMNMPLGALDSQELRVTALRDWLATHDRWLLIFDNAENTRALGQVLPGGAGHILITSRQQHWPAWTDVQLLDALGPEAAKRFLLTRTGSEDAAAATELARLTGGLPLALEQAAAYVVERSTTLAEYVSLYRHRGAELSERGEPSFYDRTVATTWTLALQDLSARLPPASVMLRACSLLAADGAPRSLFDHVPSDAPTGLQDTVVRHDALALLRRHSLVRLTGEGTVLTVHRLVAQQVRASMSSTELKEAIEFTAALLVKAMTSGAYRRSQHDRDTALLFGQVRAFAHHAQSIDARLIYEVARRAANIEQWDMAARHEGRPMLELAIANAQRAFGKEDARILPLLLERATARQRAFNGRRARRLILEDLDSALHLAQKNHGERSWEAAAVHLRLARMLADLQHQWVDFELADADFEAAESHAVKALEWLGPVADDHSGLWREAHRVMAHIAAHRGDLQRAEELFVNGLSREIGQSDRVDRWHRADDWRGAGMLMIRRH